METTYRAPGVMTGLGEHSAAVSKLGGTFAEISAVLHGLFVHEFLGDLYRITVADRETVHLRRAADLLDTVRRRDDRPLDEAREPADRVATNCRGYSVLAVAMLRAHGVPARARCGFGAYFTPDYYEDHWVVEYFEDGRWKRGDAQLDRTQRGAFKLDFDVTDLPDGAFLTGGEAWQLCRAGRARPDRFGLSSLKEAGDWWIAGNLMRDLAALRGVEVLPWDCWAPMPEPHAPVDAAYFDRMAAGSEPVTIPTEVYNALRQRIEPLP